MDFELSEEQVMLRDTTRDVLTKTYDVETVRKVTDSELGWNRDVWNSLAEIGILGLSFSEEDGGAGAGPVEVATVLTELGRALAPEPYLDSVVVPGALISAASPGHELLGALASGETLGAFAHHEAGDRWPVSAVATSFADGTLIGTKTLVPHGDCADQLVVSAREGDEIGLYLVDASAAGVTRTAYRTHDRRRGAQIVFDGAPAVRLGSGDASSIIADVEVTTQIAQCAEAIGALERCLELTTEYLKTRKQFGVTLSTFQTLTQRAADLYMWLELARSVNLYAVTALSEGKADATIASRVKLQVGKSARIIGQESIQMHGGIGMTAEYPVGHYVSRLTAIGHTLGHPDDHLASLARGIGDWEMVTVG
ncbi:acyl-CoA dehydrogenase family protein [Gordonia sp. (in: high G+C Gram-positive bacteria)]|jgi:alkylation response protein AidB-like acyl-CoA dehydrogenase|uniref:acyl-CoA dehydrogenase family protein n=1 Tax=Gordonia sp. (in: high G+C Gram-positive bacteria) TaxID=84139 RepID=UPI001D757885|nr:acyl-CoA dehydrogenase family protein [Gordonia sp. (in: high G+C Gram-positive bacteria)]MCB1296608.1 acyl-CoA dehydrogenase family protein [Gordonia sp. (in: high G+C Gram-positive bacteria)]HMS74434.1 acyl-CoA dehydrogenase family protein [Gordonia sp. (in: high G+C Gram-positive bacteria)]